MIDRRKHFECSADTLCTLGHDAQTDMGFIIPTIIALKTLAIVTHLKAPLRLLLHVKPDARSTRVLACIGKRLLHDVQHL